MRSQTARSRASMLHDATTPGPAADAKSRPADSQPARIEEAERAVGAPASLRRGPGRGLVPALDRPGAGVRHPGQVGVQHEAAGPDGFAAGAGAATGSAELAAGHGRRP